MLPNQAVEQVTRVIEMGPIPDGFWSVEDIILPLTIDEYWKLFLTDGAKAGYSTFNTAWHKNNYTVHDGLWFSPPEQKYSTFRGKPCTS